MRTKTFFSAMYMCGVIEITRAILIHRLTQFWSDSKNRKRAVIAFERLRERKESTSKIFTVPEVEKLAGKSSRARRR